MLCDDDLYVVIVEDDCKSESEGNPEEPYEMKQELLDEDSVGIVNYLLDTATEYGEILHINEEINDRNMIKSEYSDAYPLELEYYEELEPNFIYDCELDFIPKSEDNVEDYASKSNKVSYADSKDDDYEPDYLCEDDLFYNEENEVAKRPKKKKARKKKKKNKLKNNGIIYWRGTKRKIVSYIQKIREKNQEFRDNEELLINYLAKKMKQTRRPDPPSDYYVKVGRYYRCVLCDIESITEPAVHRHYQEKHGERYLYCYACGASFRSTTNLYKHEKKNCGAPDINIVLKARARSLGRKGRSRPFIPDFSTLPPQRFNCTECSASFTNKYSLEPHLRMHRGERPYLCPHCPRAYTSAVVLSHHIRSHSTEQYICDHCRRSFKDKGKLVVHMATHELLKRFPCAECSKRYSSKADLVIHVNRDHRKLPLPFACKICPKRFSRMAVFKIHMRKAHGMVIMTSTMFARSLPDMTDTQLRQAMVVIKEQGFEQKHAMDSINEL